MSARNAGLGAPALPQVNLLPPEVRSKRTLSVVKRWLAVAVLATLVVAGLGYAFAAKQESDATTQLEDERGRTNDLLAEQATYAEVPRVLGKLQDIKDARELGMSTEVLWEDYLGAIVAVTPQDVTIETINYSGASPMTAPGLPANELFAPSVGSITVVGRAEVVPDTAEWMDALDSVPGLRDSWISVAEIAGDDEDERYYQFTSTVQVDQSAYANRFAPTAEQEGEG